MKIDKAQAKRDAEIYTSLLSERAVISDIDTEEVRGEIRYMFTVYDPKYPQKFECTGIKELALVLSAMWACYLKSRFDLGLE